MPTIRPKPPHVITPQEVYNTLKNAFYERPGDITNAARITNISWKAARAAYLGLPSSKYNLGAKGIRETLEDEAKAKREAEIEAAVEYRSRTVEAAAKQKQLVEEAQKAEESILRLARSDVLQGFGGLARIGEGINQLMVRLNEQLKAGVGPNGQPLWLKPLEVMRLMREYAQSSRQLAQTAETLLAIERLRANLPTQIVGIDVQTMTLDQAEESHRLAGVALERARALGIMLPDKNGGGSSN